MASDVVREHQTIIEIVFLIEQRELDVWVCGYFKRHHWERVMRPIRSLCSKNN